MSSAFQFGEDIEHYSPFQRHEGVEQRGAGRCRQEDGLAGVFLRQGPADIAFGDEGRNQPAGARRIDGQLVGDVADGDFGDEAMPKAAGEAGQRRQRLELGLFDIEAERGEDIAHRLALEEAPSPRKDGGIDADQRFRDFGGETALPGMGGDAIEVRPDRSGFGGGNGFGVLIYKHVAASTQNVRLSIR